MSTTLLNLAWLIPVFPFLAFLAIALFANKDNELSHILAITAICTSFVTAQIVFWSAVGVLAPTPVGGGDHAFLSVADWLPTGITNFQASIWIDPLSTVMLFMVPITCLMIFIYSVGYMNFGTPEQDSRYARFFAYIALFATGMLGMVVSGNLLMLFIFWEIMGLCSYLLIGFWFEKNYLDPNKITPRQAGLKAFITTRVGDLFFLLGLLALYSTAGSLQFRDIFSPEMLHHLGESTIYLSPLNLYLPALPTIALLFFGGTVGKSAQVPLHVWLPDAMEGPTPVSALIHAATMVSAGVYLVARMWPLTFAAAGIAPGVVLWIGAITAAYGAVIGVFQNDIKGVLAFSTISQLGYMITALGLGAAATSPALQIGAYVAGVFHLITHAFFKALLFLASGSVIHGIEHGHHHAHAHGEHHEKEEEHGHEEFNPNDMKNMGGLRKRMPRTFWTFLAGGLALSGVPLITAGFWSKDEILAMAWGIHPAIFWILTVSAGLTAFYTARQISMTFLGQPRTKAAEHAPESVASMTVPLIILAVFAISLGWAGIPDNFPVIGPLVPNWIHGFVEKTIEEYVHVEHAAVGHMASLALSEAGGHAFNWTPLIIVFCFAMGGLGLGFLVYWKWMPLTRADELDPLERGMRKLGLGFLYEFLRRRAMFDELYQWTFIKGSILIAGAFAWFDSTIIDGIANGIGWLGRTLSNLSYRYIDVAIIDAFFNLVGQVTTVIASANRWFDATVVNGAVDMTGNATAWTGKRLRKIQTGQVQSYLLVATISVLAFLGVYLYGTMWLNW
ncbi:MAG: proton-conducting transporter membrane subunit [Chloroflexota bacterium]|nr:proton-conducting transporter membrane subunit [Chloroflexota bacterium]